ncbi:MAG: bile acid:sodium symporter family protein [Leptospiraceae bacterium]|nr:bile acid:sodium symporter family protein [Leptospiraceae bacterium]MDW8305869.1 bile acid:sodium symporter family protein [Leptospiraceae bacterium]
MELSFLTADLTQLIWQKVQSGAGMINNREKPLLALMVFVIMFGMGATLSLQDFKNALKKPKGMITGFLSQFGVMPLVAFTLSLILRLDPVNALALILVGCLPAGSTSNMFAYFSRGDLALSIAMTSASTLMAIIMTPILLNFYGHLSLFGIPSIVDQMTELMQSMNLLESGSGVKFQIPNKDIIVSLFLVLIPVILGMILRKKSPGWAKAAEDTAGFMAVIIIVFLLGSVVVRHNDLLLATSGKIYFAAIMVGLGGFLFGYLFSWALGVPPRWRRTISLETGIQNGPLAFAIVMMSFKEPLQSQMLWLPIMYSAFIVLTSSLLTLFFRRIGKEDYELFVNESVQRELFGPNYRQGMSGPKPAQ